jgi:AdoMet-dependent rRNA methyltransferase SPB1
MQLQMTAPLDIGLEHTDPTLGLGQEDMFDLEDTEEGLRRKGGISFLVRQSGDVVISDEEGDDSSSESDDFPYSEEEELKRTAGLEAELDGLYDAYQERRRETDAKFKVQESRNRNTEREEWHGIQQQANGEDDYESAEGGWDATRQAIVEVAGESSSDESDTDGSTSPPAVGQKRKCTNAGGEAHKRARLVTKLREQALQPSRAAQVWFSRDVFAGIEGINNIEDDEDLEDFTVDREGQDDGDSWQDETGDEVAVPPLHSPSLILTTFQNLPSIRGNDDFELAPQGAEVDVEMWNAENDDEEQKKQTTIKSKSLFSIQP